MTTLKELMLTDEEMVNAVWEAGEKYELNGGDISRIDQKTRFRWIRDAQLQKALKGLSERGMVLLDEDQSPPSMICHGQDPVSVHSATIALMKHYGFRRVIDLKDKI